MVLKQMKDSNIDINQAFAAVDTQGQGKIDVMQFAELVNLGSKSASKSEVDLLFRVVDKQNKGYLEKMDLTEAFNNIESVLNSKINTLPKDLFMPLFEKVRNRLNLSGDAIYDKFKNEKTGKVDVPAMTKIFLQFLGIQLTEDEQTTVAAYLEQYFHHTELTQQETSQLFMMDFQHRSLGGGSQPQALQTLTKIK